MWAIELVCVVGSLTAPLSRLSASRALSNLQQLYYLLDFRVETIQLSTAMYYAEARLTVWLTAAATIIYLIPTEWWIQL